MVVYGWKLTASDAAAETMLPPAFGTAALGAWVGLGAAVAAAGGAGSGPEVGTGAVVAAGAPVGAAGDWAGSCR